MRLLFGHDAAVIHWAAQKLGSCFYGCLGGIGVLDKEGNLSGAAVLHDWTATNVELSYYGDFSSDMAKAIAWKAFDVNGVLRVSANVPRRKKRILRAMPKLGFICEGVKRCYYGPYKADDAVMFGMLKENAERYLRRKENVQTKAA